MDLESLESFLEVEKHKNFTKAAESLFCTQAAVSMRIKRLETPWNAACSNAAAGVWS